METGNHTLVKHRKTDPTNAPDKTLALETLDSILVERPKRVVNRLHHLSLDAGYDYADVVEGVLERKLTHLGRRLIKLH